MVVLFYHRRSFFSIVRFYWTCSPLSLLGLFWSWKRDSNLQPMVVVKCGLTLTRIFYFEKEHDEYRKLIYVKVSRYIAF